MKKTILTLLLALVGMAQLPATTIAYTATAKVEPSNKGAFGSATYDHSDWNSSTKEGCLYFDGDVTEIGLSAFGGRSSLTSITLPASVNSIGVLAFCNCKSLISITCLATTPPTLGEDAFHNLPTEGTLYIPEGSDYSSWTGTGKPLAGWTVKKAVPTVTLTIRLAGITEQALNLPQGDTYIYKDHPVTGNTITALKFNGVDVLSQFTDGRFTTPALTMNSVLEVTYSNAGGGLEGDMTGDGVVDVSDVTRVVSIILNAK